jgi:hypothetical protein
MPKMPKMPRVPKFGKPKEKPGLPNHEDWKAQKKIGEVTLDMDFVFYDFQL